MDMDMDSFEALCGFRPLHEIAAHVRRVEPLRRLLLLAQQGQGQHTHVAEAVERITSDNNAVETLDDSGRRDTLRTLFTALMHSEPHHVQECLREILQSGSGSQRGDTEALVARLDSQYPGDVGCLAAYFLNHVRLRAGEALFLGPNEPHAYLCGDMVECMACSDNVVRAGLTPKFRDVQALCEMLTYRDDALDSTMRLHSGTKIAQHVALYRPPPQFPEFQVLRVDGPATLGLHSVSIAIVVDGTGTMRVTGRGGDGERQFKRGQAFVMCGGGAQLSVQFDDPKSSGLVFIASSRGGDY